MIAPAHPDSAPSGLRPGGGIRLACFDWGEYEYEYTHRYVEKDLPATYVNTNQIDCKGEEVTNYLLFEEPKK